MKDTLRTLFWFILRFFEKGDEPFTYKPLNRKILIIVGVLFSGLSLVSAFLADTSSGFGAFIPIAVFFLVGLVCLVVGALGSDRAVTNIWGNR